MSAETDIDTGIRFNRGDRVLVRDKPLLGPRIVLHVRTSFAGEPEFNGPVACCPEDELWRWQAWWRAWRATELRYDQCELVPCPAAYEALPPADRHFETLRWINRNRSLLEEAHGIRAVALAEKMVRRRIIFRETITAALAAEPGASAIRQAEIAFEEAVGK